MNPKIKNIIFFTGIALVMILVYVFFIKKDSEQANLVTTSLNTNKIVSSTLPKSDATQEANSQIAKDFLSLLLSVKNITLDDAIFNDIAFTSLRDSSIILTPLGNEGRPNPFAPIGAEASPNIVNTPNQSTSPSNPDSLPVSPLTN
ncbi:MAG: hypothetical protein UU24_C0007G0008 [Candidatus Nomurabacteria bacterium GW2011_GWA2_40_9]|uniref:Uncharacterized protein n=1 Tax=Candidatus Nomurabacteria bacterium GW2011_GWA2_40_9 TaxID=1618734 RepID=A0A0G0TXC6_9BACT|nr:MAG: hypothetical protein UU24_C0007G0008 [Candidatus Nomurabacteria bacterium GW2011_GWA2_40_9]